MCYVGRGESDVILCRFYLILTSTPIDPPHSLASIPLFTQVCNPHRISQQKDCLVYSVGSNGKAEFEKAVMEEIGNHCEVHSKFNSYLSPILYY
jgi:hypothetical protein